MASPMEIDTQEDTSATTRWYNQIRQRYVDAASMDRDSFVGACAYLAMLLDIGYKPPYSATDEFIVKYFTCNALEVSMRDQYHVWYSEHATEPHKEQVLTTPALGAIRDENKDDFDDMVVYMYETIRDVAVEHPDAHVRPAPARDVAVGSTQLDFVYIPYACPEGEPHAAPLRSDNVIFALRYNSELDTIYMAMTRGNAFLGWIKRAHQAWARDWAGLRGRVMSTEPFINLDGGGPCVQGIVELLVGEDAS